MAPSSSSARRPACPYCGSNIPAAWTSPGCPACGASLQAPRVRTPEGAERTLPNLEQELVALNERLIDAGAINAEDAFSLGCWMSGFLVILAGVLSFYLLGRNWAIVTIVVVTATIVATGVSTILSLRAKDGTMRRAYREHIAPEVADLARIHDLSWPQMESLARESLAVEDPLRIYVTQEKSQGAGLES